MARKTKDTALSALRDFLAEVAPDVRLPNGRLDVSGQSVNFSERIIGAVTSTS
ncbi:hypothetical protein LP7551_01127 [Roseibium album]|nr:hypothetical protein LP7551_01127 [Roseibium album]